MGVRGGGAKTPAHTSRRKKKSQRKSWVDRARGPIRVPSKGTEEERNIKKKE